MIGIVDYGVGNVQAFLNVYKRLNIDAVACSNAEMLRRASKLILPGVGAFDHAMSRLTASGMRDTLEELVLHGGIPVLGVCVGMQMLGRSSEEGALRGLAWIDGDVRALAARVVDGLLPIPHMGWNDVQPVAENRLFAGFGSESRFYFLHSYYFQCDRPENVAATCSYGAQFSCAVRARNVCGVQFHPEKSHQFGTRLLKNFAELPC